MQSRVLAAALVCGAAGGCAQRPAAAPAPVVVTPAPAPVASPPLLVDRTVPPSLAAAKPLALPAVVTRTLSNGLTLVVVEHHELPLADFVLLVKTGGEADPRDHVGLANVTAALLDEGTTTRSALEIADQEAYLGVSLNASSGWDASTISLHTPTAQMDSALALMADVVLRPSFPAAELERLRKERLTELLQLKDRGPAIADRAYATVLFGDEHPYGRPLIGSERTIRRITRRDVRRFYDSYFRPNNASLLVVGDVTADEVQRRAEAIFGGWARKDVPVTPAAKARTATAKTTIHLIDKPGAAQSSVRIGSIGVARSTEDYFPILVMNTILGGSFTSRLNQNLRETKGYTYGAGSNFSMRRLSGPFTARAEIVAAKTDSALLEFMKELRSIRDTVPSSELSKAKRYLQLQLPGEFETTSDIAAQLVPLVLYDLPLDFYNAYVQRLDAVTQSDVQRVAEKYVDPANLNIVIVGDRKLIEAGLQGTKVGDLTLRDLEGRPVRP